MLEPLPFLLGIILAREQTIKTLQPSQPPNISGGPRGFQGPGTCSEEGKGGPEEFGAHVCIPSFSVTFSSPA